MKTARRKFVVQRAVRSRVPVFLGLFGPSSSGKTVSALRLATGICRVTGGRVAVIDTEARRALHHADRWDFDHVVFGAPFSPLAYLDAIETCVEAGASAIVVDSGSHEHEGPGGVLEWHAKEVERKAGGDEAKADRVNMLAWSAPKQARRRLINTIVQLPVSVVFCFRAKEKMKIESKEKPKALGWMPIAGDEWFYEMTIAALLEPGARGVPTWHPEDPGSKACVKLPDWARPIFPDKAQLNEDMGEALARWAEGTVLPTSAQLFEGYANVDDAASLGALERDRAALWEKLSRDDKVAMKQASDAAHARVSAAAEKTTAEPDVESGELSAEEQERMAAALEEENARARAAKED